MVHLPPLRLSHPHPRFPPLLSFAICLPSWLSLCLRSGNTQGWPRARWGRHRDSNKMPHLHRPPEPRLLASAPYSLASPPSGPRCCASCRTQRTPLWRDAEDGTPLCNACGIRSSGWREEFGCLASVGFWEGKHSPLGKMVPVW